MAWGNMKARCYNPKWNGYEHYGGRGIKVCDEWHTFEGFWLWAQLNYDDKLSLDRKDTDKDYCPGNCRWVNMTAQQQGRRKKNCCSVSSSKYIGTHKHNQRWVARAKSKGNDVYLGTFNTEEEAAKARDDFVIEHYDKYATLNFPLKG
jgi:hypothetical protein